VRYTEFLNKLNALWCCWCTSTEEHTQFTSCTWSCSDGTECVRTLVNPRKHGTKGANWIVLGPPAYELAYASF